MNKNAIITGFIGLVSGLVIAGGTAAYAVNDNNSGTMKMFGIHTNNVGQKPMVMNMPASSTSMGGMVASLNGKTGDDFDRTFVSEMIMHHQGAIDMAKLAQQNAKHDDVKTLAGNIITAQTTEINQMKAWQSQWGYISSSSQSGDMMNMSN